MPLMAPHYWPTWFGFGLLRLLILLPYPVIVSLGRWLGRAARLLSRSRRHIAATNLRACFPELGDQEREQLLRRHFESLGIGLFEVAMGWWKPEATLRRLAHVQGLQNLEAGLASGRGVLLLSAHFTCLELTARLLSLYAPFHAMYREHENPVVEFIMAGARNRVTSNAIQSDNVRGLIRSLKQGNTVWYAADRNTQRTQAVFVEFFGHLATTNTATSRIPRITGALVVPFHGIRRPGGDGYDVIIEPALEGYPSDDVEADLLRVNRIIEGWVRRHPEQYLWVHRRFRLRPNREDPPFYGWASRKKRKRV